jgi:hypothetical protein
VVAKSPAGEQEAGLAKLLEQLGRLNATPEVVPARLRNDPAVAILAVALEMLGW